MTKFAMNDLRTMVEAYWNDEDTRNIFAAEIKPVLAEVMERRSELGPELSSEEFDNILRSGIEQILLSPDDGDLKRWAVDCLEMRRDRLEKERGDEPSREMGFGKMR